MNACLFWIVGIALIASWNFSYSTTKAENCNPVEMAYSRPFNFPRRQD